MSGRYIPPNRRSDAPPSPAGGEQPRSYGGGEPRERRNYGGGGGERSYGGGEPRGYSGERSYGGGEPRTYSDRGGRYSSSGYRGGDREGGGGGGYRGGSDAGFRTERDQYSSYPSSRPYDAPYSGGGRGGYRKETSDYRRDSEFRGGYAPREQYGRGGGEHSEYRRGGGGGGGYDYPRSDSYRRDDYRGESSYHPSSSRGYGGYQSEYRGEGSYRGGGGEGSYRGGYRGDAAPRGNFLHKLVDVNPDSQGGLIIGKKGETVKRLQATHNVKITVPAKGSGESITVSGDRVLVERCVNDIYDILKIPHLAEGKNGRINSSSKLVVRVPNVDKVVVVHSAGGLIVGEERDIAELAENINITLWTRRNSPEYLNALRKMNDLYQADIKEPELPHPKHRPRRIHPDEYRELTDVIVHTEMFCVRSIPISALHQLLKGDTAALRQTLIDTVSYIQSNYNGIDVDPQADLLPEYFGTPELHRLFSALADEHSNLQTVLQTIPPNFHFLVGVEPATFKDAYLYHYYSQQNPDQPKPPKYQLTIFHGRCRSNNEWFQGEDTPIDIIRKTMWSGALKEITDESNLKKEVLSRFLPEQTPIILAPFPSKSSVTPTAAVIFVLSIDHAISRELLAELTAVHEESQNEVTGDIRTRIGLLTNGKRS